jgi:hypothetical protein
MNSLQQPHEVRLRGLQAVAKREVCADATDLAWRRSSRERRDDFERKARLGAWSGFLNDVIRRDSRHAKASALGA